MAECSSEQQFIPGDDWAFVLYVGVFDRKVRTFEPMDLSGHTDLRLECALVGSSSEAWNAVVSPTAGQPQLTPKGPVVLSALATQGAGVLAVTALPVSLPQKLPKPPGTFTLRFASGVAVLKSEAASGALSLQVEPLAAGLGNGEQAPTGAVLVDVPRAITATQTPGEYELQLTGILAGKKSTLFLGGISVRGDVP